MKLDFFPVKNDNLMCVTDKGNIIAKAGMSVDAIADALENGDCRVVEGKGAYEGTATIFVGFGSQNTVAVEVKSLKARKTSPAAHVEITYLD